MNYELNIGQWLKAILLLFTFHLVGELVEPSLLTPCAAQVFRAAGPDMVEVGERFRVEFSHSLSDASDPEWPSFAGFEVQYGPSVSRSSSVQIINGNMTSSSSITYSFILLATKAGTFTINPATTTSDGKTYRTQPLRIRVVGSGTASGQRQQQNARSSQEIQRSKGSGRDLFMTANASRVNVYEQEAILITYKVFTQVNVTALEGKMPTLDGFQIQEIPLPREKSFDYEVYNGQRYNSVVWAQYIVYPQKSGDLVIPAITYEATEVRASRAVDPIDAFFNGVSTTEVKRKIVTPKLTIHVSSLPSKPDNFCGAVGDFSVSSSVSTDNLKANDALTLRVRLKGTGNMKLINSPEIAFPKDFEIYDPKVNDNFSLTKNGLSGVKEFEYLVVPRHKGKFTIPAADFTYFDTKTHTYKTLSTQPFTVNVEKGNGSSSSSVDFSSQQQVRQLATDIRYIKTGNVRLQGDSGTLFSSWTYWLLYPLILIIAVAIAVIGRKRITDNANVAKTRGKKANKVAIRRLKNAAKLLANHDREHFYDEVMRALLGYTADKLSIPLARLNKDNIQSELQSRNVEQSLIDLFIKCLNDCEFARYAPGNPNETMENIYDGAVNAITNMESKINKSTRKKDNKSTRQQDSKLASWLILFVLFTFHFSLFTPSVAKAQTKAEADTLYVQEDYAGAAKLYEKILSEQGIAADIYYNLGNCYYKLDDIPHAILNYERARLLDPSDAAIMENLALARGKTTDRVTPPSELFFVTWWRNLVNCLAIDSWLILAIAAFALFLLGLLIYAFVPSSILRRVGVCSSLLGLTLTILSILCALSQYRLLTHRNYAIIISPAVNVKSTPSEGSTDLFIIHEGSKVEITDDTMTDWLEIKLEEGKQGWIEKNALEVI